MWRSTLRFTRDEKGQTLVVTALGMTVLMGMMGLAIDVGLMFRAKRIAQTAADSAAIAAALDYEYNGSTTSAATAARAAAGSNGISNTASNVAVNFSPNITSAWHNTSGYVQAVVNLPNPTLFISAFYRTATPFTVTARAIAGTTPSVACIYVLDPTDASALYIQGSADISTPNCGIQVNSNSPDAFCDQGSASIEANFLHIVGGQSGKGRCAKAPGTTPVTTGVAPTGDPFNNMTGPIPATDCTGANTVTASTINVVHHDPVEPGHHRFNHCFGDLLQREEPDDIGRCDAWDSRRESDIRLRGWGGHRWNSHCKRNHRRLSRHVQSGQFSVDGECTCEPGVHLQRDSGHATFVKHEGRDMQGRAWRTMPSAPIRQRLGRPEWDCLCANLTGLPAGQRRRDGGGWGRRISNLFESVDDGHYE